MKNLIATIEIPKNSQVKYEYDRKKKLLVIDRILRNGFSYPTNYGFIKNTLDWDGDELDVLIYSNEIFYPGVEIKIKLIGAMQMIDEGETDTKLIAIHSDDYRLVQINTFEDLPKTWLIKIKTFFSNYKNWKGKNTTQVKGFKDIKWAWNEYLDCVKLYDKYKNLSKAMFLKQMKQKYPNKYHQ